MESKSIPGPFWLGGASLLVVIGCLMPWLGILFANIAGTDVDQGKVAIAAGLAGIVVAFLRYRGYLTSWPYYLLGTVASSIAMGACVWFIYNLDRNAEPDDPEILGALKAGFWIALTGAFAAFLSTMVQIWDNEVQH